MACLRDSPTTTSQRATDEITVDQVKDLWTVTLTPLFTLLGTSLAWYFR